MFKEILKKASALGLLMVAFASQAGLVANWTFMGAAPDVPGKRGWFNAAYNSDSEQILYFGGSCQDASSASRCNDIWELDPLNNFWTEMAENVGCQSIQHSPPSPRDSVGVIYDDYNHYIWVFGGLGTRCNKKTFSTTALSGTTLDTIYFDSGIPEQADDHYRLWTVKAGKYQAYVESYDPATGKIVLSTPIQDLSEGVEFYLYPQRGGGLFYYDIANDSWQGFDAPFWNYSGAKPSNRLNPSFSYSSSENAIVMFGGITNLNDTWALDVETKQWVNMIPHLQDGSPPARTYLSDGMAYDSDNDVFIMFGGTCAEKRDCTKGSLLSDTWVYSLSENKWTQMNPANAPQPRNQHQMAYDSDNKVIVLFGGQSADKSLLNDTWVYDVNTNTWTDVTPTLKPPAIMRSALVYDPSRKITAMYGGSSSSRLSDVWSLELIDDGLIPPNQEPNAEIVIVTSPTEVNQEVQFDASTSTDIDGEILSYQWDFGDGNIASTVSPIHTYSQTGIYTVTLTVTDDQGSTDITTAEIDIVEPVTPPVLSMDSIVIKASIDDLSIEEVMIEGSQIPVSAGQFEYQINNPQATQTITIEAINFDGVQTVKTITVNIDDE